MVPFRNQSIKQITHLPSYRRKNSFIFLSTRQEKMNVCQKYNWSQANLAYHQARLVIREERKRRGRTHEFIETDLWSNVLKEQALPANKKVIRVCDRAADIYEVFAETKEYGCSHIIRLKHDRAVLPECTHIKSLMRDLGSMGQTQIEKRIKNRTKSEMIKLNMN